MVWKKSDQINQGLYQIERNLGEGRYGTTYLASSKRLNSYFAIKTLSYSARQSPRLSRIQEIFVQEGQRLSSCSHPYIVKTGILFQEGGFWCLPMEYLAGPSLSEYQKTALAMQEALVYINQIGSALSYIHKEKGFCHLDVRPENIRLRTYNNITEAVLIDFGSALNFFDQVTTTRTISKAGGYAPLELHGGRLDLLSPSTDIYSLGATLFTLVTGKEPPLATERSPAISYLDFPKYVDRHSCDAIEWAMQLDRAKRPQSVDEWLEFLNNPRKEKPKVEKKIPWLAIIGVIAAMLAGIGAMLSGVADFGGTIKLPSPQTQPNTK